MSNKSKSYVRPPRGVKSFLSRRKQPPPAPAPAKPPYTPIKAAPTPTSIYDAIPTKAGIFNPTVHPTIFAYICACFAKQQPAETAGYFNWDEQENMLNWAWSDPSDNKETSGGVEYGTAKMRMAWNDDGIPNGQWHTHPGLTTFWSPTDKEGQLQFVNELIKVNPTGYFCFIVLDQLDWYATRLVWANGTVSHKETGYASINGVPLRGVQRQVYTAPAHYGTYTPKGKVTSIYKVADPTIVGEKHNLHYAELFNIFFTPKYDWEGLYEAIEQYYPGMYHDIIGETVSWDWLKRDFDTQFFGDGGLYPNMYDGLDGRL